MEVIENPHLEPQPGAAHPSFRGLIPLRGHILPVIDLAVWLGIEKVQAPRDNVIVTEFSKTVTGFVVSGVTGIHRVGWPEVIPPDGYMGRRQVTDDQGTRNVEEMCDTFPLSYWTARVAARRAVVAAAG